MAFVTAVFCEILRAYTVRTWEFSFSKAVFNRNPWLHVTALFSATMTILITLIPGAQDVFSVVSLDWW